MRGSGKAGAAPSEHVTPRGMPLRYAGPSVALHRLNGPNRNDIFREIGNIQAGCWAHSNGGKIATAHSNGDIVLWQLPESALPGEDTSPFHPSLVIPCYYGIPALVPPSYSPSL